MNIKDLKPIPKYILKLIQRFDSGYIRSCSGFTRYYAYLIKQRSELVLITVACKNRGRKWFCKQVIVHSVQSNECFGKDIVFCRMGGHITGWYEEGLTRYRKWWETGEWEPYVENFFNNPPVLNPEYALRLPEYKYSAIDCFGRWDILKYLRLYKRYPQAEFLVKFGMIDLALSTQILRKVGSDKHFRKWLANNRAELSMKIYYVETILQAYQTGKPMSEIQAYLKRKKSFDHEADYKPIRKQFKGNRLELFFNYIDKYKISYRSYLDYLNACVFLGLDMNDDKNAFPHDFKRWHDIRIDEYHTAKILKDEEDRKDFYQKFAVVANKYLPLQSTSNDTFIVVIARSPAELIQEGNALNHCVGRMGYDQKFVREESLIFFIRNATEPDTPFVTVEYSPKKKQILQYHGENNILPAENVKKFINDVWLPFANKTTNKILRKNAA